MNVLSVEGLSKSLGERTLFEDLNFGLQAGEKVALIARNGTGKTSLLRILVGEESPDRGQVVYRKGLRLGYVDQDPQFPAGVSALDWLLDSPLETLRAVLAYEHASWRPHEPDALTHALSEMERLNAWDAEAQVRAVLTQMELPLADLPIENLSGGQRKRLALARLLIQQPDVVLLDEPTNHLDLDLIETLESTLRDAPFALLMVTHDRYFLETVCDRILELEDQTLYRYDGNYSYYLEKKEERLSTQRTSNERAKNLYRRELEWIRQTPQARTGKSKARISAFDNVQQAAKNRVQQGTVQLEIKGERLGSKIIEWHKVRKAYGEKLIVDQFTYTFKRGDRLGLVGRNGVGKSTFLKLITGEAEVDGGKVVVGETVRLGHYRQENPPFDPEKRVIDIVKDIAEVIPLAKGKTLTASQLLDRFNFEGDQQYTFVNKLSGGERRRLYLMTVLMANPNVLIFDEPTNDLDVQTLQALEDFLEGFDGCLLIVSHDRAFLDKLTNHLLIFEGEGVIRDFNGTTGEWREAARAAAKARAAADSAAAAAQRAASSLSSSSSTTANKTGDKPSSTVATPGLSPSAKRSYKEEREWDELDRSLPVWEARRAEIALLFAQPPAGAALDFAALTEESRQLTQRIEEAELRWLELSDKSPHV
jgi:ATP-binding cassette subfamily F protein uup